MLPLRNSHGQSESTCRKSEKVSNSEFAQLTLHLLSSIHPLSGIDRGRFLGSSVKATRQDIHLLSMAISAADLQVINVPATFHVVREMYEFVLTYRGGM